MSLPINQRERVSENLKKSLTNYKELTLPKIQLEKAQELEKANVLKFYSEKEILDYMEKAKSSNDEDTIDEAKEVAGSLKKSIVVNEKGEEAKMYAMPLVEIVDEIQKSETGEDQKLEKAVYSDNALNRKMGRVGQSYGGGSDKKKDDAQPDSKLVDKKLSEKVDSMSNEKAKELLGKLKATKEKYGSQDKDSKKLQSMLESKLKDGDKKDSDSKGGESKMVADADKIKGEYESLKKEVKKNPSEENKAKLAAKEGQLKRVADAIRSKRAEAAK